MGDIVNAVADLVGIGPASKQASATKSAASQAAASANYAMELQKAIADRQIDTQKEMFYKNVEMQEPWRAAGVNALNQMQAGAYALPGEFKAKTALPGAFTGKVNMMADPGYQFRLSEGLKALDRQAAARGGLISGSALKGAQRYGQDYASGEYQNAYNRALTEYQSRVQQSQMGYGREMDAYNAALQRAGTGYNRLASQAGLGQTTVGQLGQAGQQMAGAIGNALGTYGSNVGNISMANAANQGNAALSLGNIRASQYGSIGGALNQALNTNWSQVGSNLNSLFGGGGSTYGMGSINPSSGEYYGSLEF